MNNKIRLIALLVALMLVLGAFASCTPGGSDTGNGENNGNGSTDGGNNGEGEGGLPVNTEKYVATISTTFSTDDDRMIEIIAHMGESVTVVSTDGDSIRIHAESEVGMSSFESEYVYVDSVLYSFSKVNVDGKSASSYEKAAMSAEDSADLIQKAGPGASVGSADFMTKERNKEGNITTYVCSNMMSTSRDSISEIFSKRFAGYNATVRLVSAEYNLELIGDANKSSELACHFIVTMDGVDYSFTMNLKTEYEYTDDVSISVPAEADKYSDVPLKDIIG